METLVDLMHVIVDCSACTGDVGDISFTTQKNPKQNKKKSIHRNSDFLNLVVMVAVVICCIRIQLNGYQFIYSNSIPFLWLAAKFQTQFAYSTCKRLISHWPIYRIKSVYWLVIRCVNIRLNCCLTFYLVYLVRDTPAHFVIHFRNYSGIALLIFVSGEEKKRNLFEFTVENLFHLQ